MSECSSATRGPYRAHARRVAEALQAKGFSVFWDAKIRPGEDWRQTILDELKASAAIVVLWSVASVQSAWVLEEATEADGRKVLVPAVVDGVAPLSGSADFTRWRYDRKVTIDCEAPREYRRGGGEVGPR